MWFMFVSFMESGIKFLWILQSRLVKKGVNPKDKYERQIGLASTNVGQLAQPFKRLYGPLFYIIFHCATSLEHGLTSIGVVPAHRRDVLACLLKVAQRDPYSTLAVYEHNKRIAMINYVPRKNSNVLLLTSCRTKLKVDNQQGDKIPNIMNSYNLGKRNVDNMDARIEDFCCIRKTNR
ncbi:hypothetical protein Tsp_00343 [Trichinella spiralis]|uniref:hypothetical protein n=1 Tax=Trichinella spiralis TaxID=6334 RepID=UPI0001EFCE42|nr:hypothetical protein Tsp_00343 [Trichinella spiralis]